MRGIIPGAALAVMLGAHAATAATCAQPEGSAAEVAVIADALNRFRAERGLAALAVSPQLTRSANGYACALVARNAFSHTVGGSAKTRMRKAGCNARLVGENIAMGYRQGAQVFRQWLDSPGHRKVMSLNGVAIMGIGVAAPGPGQGGGPRWVLQVAAPCR